MLRGKFKYRKTKKSGKNGGNILQPRGYESGEVGGVKTVVHTKA